MITMPLISVIVPVYKVEDYIDRCLHSIIEQTYTNLEIILVDDGSPDNCPEICDAWQLKDSRIKVIHKKNGGLSDARNVGMKHATGEYISFIDSDDWIDTHFFEILHTVMSNTNSDIVECSAKKVCNEKEIQALNNSYYKDAKSISKTTNDAMYELITDGIFHQHVWNKLYKRKIVNNYQFKKGKLHEDEFWTYHIFANAKKITYVDLELYYYFQRSTSIMGERFNIKRLDALEAKKERQELITKHFPELSLISKRNYYWSCVYLQQLSLKDAHIDEKDKINLVIKNHYKNIDLSVRDISLSKEKIWLIFTKISFLWTCRLRNLLKVGF